MPPEPFARPGPAPFRRLLSGVLLLAASALAASALAACAPTRIPPGPGPTEPRILVIDNAAEPGTPGEIPRSLPRIVMDDGFALRLRAWLPDPEGLDPDPPLKAVILALHGFNDYSRAFQASGLAWTKRGIATYAYDQRGFGEDEHAGLWAGHARLAEDVRDAAAAIAARHPGVPLYLLGESMGGAVALVAQAERPIPQVAGVILAAPAVWARERMPGYQSGALWFFARVIPWGRLSGQGLRIQASDNIPMLRGLGRDPLVIKKTRVDAIDGLTDLMSAALAAAPDFDTPALLLYGEKDEIVPRGPTFELWRNLPDHAGGPQREALYPEGWHMLLRDLQAQRVRDDIAAWIENPDAPLPSGADRVAEAALAGEGAPPEEALEGVPPEAVAPAASEEIAAPSEGPPEAALETSLERAAPATPGDEASPRS